MVRFADYSGVLQVAILAGLFLLAFAIRLFSVVRHESIIHEFDPWFNFRGAKYLVDHGFYEFHNWFDKRSWYPLGRHVGGTVYPGLMYTSAVLHDVLDALSLHIDIRDVCVLTAPLFAGFTTLSMYLLTSSAFHSPSAGLLAAAFMSVAPGYISRSVAGSYDNECIAIFALINTFYLWLRAVRSGSMAWATLAALAYLYMVAAWGGYIFIINVVPAHVLASLFMGVYSQRMYVAFSTFYLLGTLMSMQIPFVSFIPVTSPEHFAAFAVFVLLQVLQLHRFLKATLTPPTMRRVLRGTVYAVATLAVAVVAVSALGLVPSFTGRLLRLLGSSKNIAIVKSVSEHQPSPWTSFFFDLHVIVVFVPVGLCAAFLHGGDAVRAGRRRRQLTDLSLFAVLYVVLASYFSSIMVRLILILTPAAASVAGYGATTLLHACMTTLSASSLDEAQALAIDKADTTSGGGGGGGGGAQKKKATATAKAAATAAAAVVAAAATSASVAHVDVLTSPAVTSKGEMATSVAPLSLAARFSFYTRKAYALATTLVLLSTFAFFVTHSSWATSFMYSSPAVVLQSRAADGSTVVFDDFREAYTWLRHNTHEDDRVMSWWDYGYQITGMANRTVIVDNNTRNNTHIATVGYALSSPEARAIPVLRALDVDYVLVIFGGAIGYSSDDIAKFLWMIRIAGGIFPDVVETDYFGKQGYAVGEAATPAMRASLMYKMCFYRFEENNQGWDRVRQVRVPGGIKLTHLEEAFTSEHWMVRIYKVKPATQTDRFLK
jgi:dolichyl-diphosphooligosaccharide--protein glycosyltransferase